MNKLSLLIISASASFVLASRNLLAGGGDPLDLPGPSGFVATLGGEYIGISWNAIAGATGYEVYYTSNGSDPDDSDTKVATYGLQTSYYILNLDADIIYKFVVYAIINGRRTKPSEILNARPNPAYHLTVNFSNYADQWVVVTYVIKDAAGHTTITDRLSHVLTNSSGTATVPISAVRDHSLYYRVYKDIDGNGLVSSGDIRWDHEFGYDSTSWDHSRSDTVDWDIQDTHSTEP